MTSQQAEVFLQDVGQPGLIPALTINTATGDGAASSSHWVGSGETLADAVEPALVADGRLKQKHCTKSRHTF